MKRNFIIVLSAFALFACGGKSEQKKQLESIAQMENAVLQNAKSISPKDADSLVNMYKAYVEAYPQDTLSAAYLYRAADILANRKECLPAIALLDRLIKEYPKDSHAEQAAFLKGVVYGETCLNKDKAKESFEAFIAAYPSSPLVKDAKGLMELNSAEDELEMVHRWEQEAKQ